MFNLKGHNKTFLNTENQEWNANDRKNAKSKNIRSSVNIRLNDLKVNLAKVEWKKAQKNSRSNVRKLLKLFIQIYLKIIYSFIPNYINEFKKWSGL